MSIDQINPDENWDGDDLDRRDSQRGFSPDTDIGQDVRRDAGSSLCPKCQSPQIQPRHMARRIAAVIGTAAGVTTGVVRVLQATKLVSSGALAIGLRAAGGPVIGTVAGAVSAALLEGATGCALGVKFGEAIDRVILLNHRCAACGHLFSMPIDGT